MKKNKVCIHCEPVAAHPWHLQEKIEIFFDKLSSFLNPFSKSKMGDNDFEKFFIYNLINVLAKVGMVKIAPIINRVEVRNRTLVIVDEALKRGYEVNLIKFLKRPTELFQLNFPEKSIFFYALPLLDFGKNPTIDFDDKQLFGEFLKKNNFPYIPGKAFTNSKAAFDFGLNLGFPLVVKPRSGSLSCHTTVNIKGEMELKKAIQVAKIIANEILVEKFIRGYNYRAMVIGGKFIACARREPPNITGDGIHTATQLIEIKNAQFSRGDRNEKNCTLHKLEIDRRATKHLEEAGYTENSIIESGKKIYLNDKIILSCGADIHDTTDLVNEANVKLFEEIARRLNVPLIGLDVITDDISRPYYGITFGINEANSVPYVDMHHFPSHGKSRNVAMAILDEVERKYLKQQIGG